MRHSPTHPCAVVTLVAVLFHPFTGFSQSEEPEIPAVASSETAKLLSLEGKTVKVTGKIASAGKSKSGNQFLNFAGSEFVAVTFSSDVTKFPGGEPADVFDGKTVAITGPIKVYKGIPEIILGKPSMIKVIDASELVVPEPKPAEEEKEKKVEGEEAPEPKSEEDPKAAEKEPAPVKIPPVDWRKYFPE